MVEFDKNGDTFGNYLVINYQLDKTTNSYVSKVVGTWRSTLTVDIGAISWAGGSTRIPESSCSRPCEPNEIKVCTVLVLFKLTKIAVALQLRYGSCKLIFLYYFVICR